MRVRDPGSWMWAQALDLLHDAERLQRQFFRIGTREGAPCWEPPVDMYARGDNLTLLVALPGVAAQHVEVVLATAGVIVRGERPLPAALRHATLHRLEIPYGRFERRIALPQGEYRLTEQNLENGCLKLVLQRLA